AEVATAHLKARGAKVTIEQADYAGDITTAAQLANELAEKVDVVVVATDDEAVIPSLSDVDVPILHAYITSMEATAGEGSYRLAPSDELQAERLAQYLAENRKISSLGVVFENTPYGQTGAAAFEGAVTGSPATLVASQGFDSGGDIHTPLMVAEARGAKGVVIWTNDPAEASRAVIDAHKSTLSYQLAVPWNIAGPQFGKNAVSQVVPTAFREGILSVGPWAGPWLREERVRRFYRDFEESQNDVAPVRTAQVYDAVMIASRAKASGGIKEGLSQIKNFLGASTPVTFDRQREGMDPSDVWAWGFTKSESGAGSEFFPAVDTGGGFFTLIYTGLELPPEFKGALQ
ncbi:MAG TPA: ABC transporter substrate-binding protein, partial [Actinomycetota bacterium]|nr:ABC transporter substrate-binding protein [Actinomycetota bacterium]